jgi:aminoglycoside 3-N-acetyltransferase
MMYLKRRNKDMKPIIDKDRLVEDLFHLGVIKGTEVLVHSSLSSIGYVTGGAETVIEALLQAVDPKVGTVLVPTLTGTKHDNAANPPFFDQRLSPCWTGSIPEVFRHRSDAHRSLNPTHSVAAIGASAVSLTTGHEDCWTTCGFGSPFYRLSRRGGKILLLGVTLDSNTLFHTAEEIADLPYHLQDQPASCQMIDEKGNQHSRLTLLHDWGTPRQFGIAQDDFLAEGIMQVGWIGDAKCFLIDAQQMLDYTVNMLHINPKWLIGQ